MQRLVRECTVSQQHGGFFSAAICYMPPLHVTLNKADTNRTGRQITQYRMSMSILRDTSYANFRNAKSITECNMYTCHTISQDSMKSILNEEHQITHVMETLCLKS